jgi:proteasome activator subunit 4
VDLLLHVEEARFDPHSDAAFAEARKLIFVRAMMVGLKWRFKPWAKRDGLLELYLDHLDHPYKQVREVIGANINDIMQIQWVPSYPSVDHLLELNARTEGAMQVPFSLDISEHEQTVQLNAIVNMLDSGFTCVTSAIKESSAKALNHYTTTSKTGKKPQNTIIVTI